jgi:anti-anti-sigma regulatory factor
MNCWEYTKCGREPGGVNQEELGTCPASVYESSNGENKGLNAGRICWSIEKTPCKGPDNDFGNCLRCDFYKIVREEEINTFKLFNGNKRVKYNKGIINIEVGDILCYGTIASFERKFIDALVENKKLKIQLDFKDTTRLDSNALGMLLVLRSQVANREGSCICLANISDDIMKIINRHNFGRLFKVGLCS